MLIFIRFSEDNEVKLNLKMDHKFFQDLAESVNTVTKFEAEMKELFEKKMETLADFLTDAASPYGKDMYAWRKILAQYLESDIWLVDGTKDRPVVGAKNQLQLFGERVTQQHMVWFDAECRRRIWRLGGNVLTRCLFPGF